MECPNCGHQFTTHRLPRGKSKREKAANAAYKIVKEHGPMHRSNLGRMVEEVLGEKLSKQSFDPANALSTYLGSDARFQSRHGWRVGYWGIHPLHTGGAA